MKIRLALSTLLALALAREMPAEKYSWRPGEGVLPVAQVYAHVAHYNYLYPAQNMGIAAPAGVGLDMVPSWSQ